MRRDEFKDLVQDLAAYFGHTRAITERRLQLWYAECRHVPGEVLVWIYERFIRKYEKLPVNTPKAINFWWHEWKEAHPERVDWHADQVECDAPGCWHGFVFLLKPPTGLVNKQTGEEIRYECIGYCDQCAVRRSIAQDDDPNLGNVRDWEAKGFDLRNPATDRVAAGGKQPPDVGKTVNQLAEQQTGWRN